MSPQLAATLGVVATALIALVTPWLFARFKDAVAWVDTLPVPLQRALVLILTYLLSVLTSLTGIQFPTTLPGVDPTVIQGILAALVAYGLHAATQVSAAAKQNTGAKGK